MSRENSEFVDLDHEEVRDTLGRRLTEADANAAADAFEEGDFEVVEVTYPGRPSLSAPGTHSPRVDVRVPQELKRALDRLAESEGRRESELVREALEEYLARH